MDDVGRDEQHEFAGVGFGGFIGGDGLEAGQFAEAGKAANGG
jgi:hypothetical protein